MLPTAEHPFHMHNTISCPCPFKALHYAISTVIGKRDLSVPSKLCKLVFSNATKGRHRITNRYEMCILLELQYIVRTFPT